GHRPPVRFLGQSLCAGGDRMRSRARRGACRSRAKARRNRRSPRGPGPRRRNAMMSPTVTLIIKVTNACDMRCRYCFIEPSIFHKTMKIETARRVVRAFLDSSYFQNVHFVWHGGEPLLRGRGFFEQILAEQQARPTRVVYTNATQTNGTHLDDEMMDFLLANDFG